MYTLRIRTLFAILRRDVGSATMEPRKVMHTRVERSEDGLKTESEKAERM
jgi:hypothetical protein